MKNMSRASTKRTSSSPNVSVDSFGQPIGQSTCVEPILELPLTLVIPLLHRLHAPVAVGSGSDPRIRSRGGPARGHDGGPLLLRGQLLEPEAEQDGVGGRHRRGDAAEAGRTSKFWVRAGCPRADQQCPRAEAVLEAVLVLRAGFVTIRVSSTASPFSPVKGSVT